MAYFAYYSLLCPKVKKIEKKEKVEEGKKF
jgi:hypothetical protein